MNNKQAAYYALGVLFLINVLNFFDRQIIGAIGEPIRKEFGLGDTELGVLNVAFTLIYAFVGLPLGRLADSYRRKTILSVGVFVWSIFTAASGLANSFWQIFAMRLGVGIGEAACAPAANSLIGDYFPAEKRAKATSVFMLGLPVGLALSFAISGAVAKNYGWRTAFLVAGLPGLLCVLLTFFIREPMRGAVEKINVGAKKRAGSTYKNIIASPTMRWIILSGTLHNFNLYAISAFMNSYLIRFHGLDIQSAGFVSTIIYGGLSLPGLLGGGALGDWANKRRTDGAMLVVTLATLLSIPFFFFALNAEAGNIKTFLFLMGGSVAFMYFYYSIIYATIANVTEPASRGTAMAVYFMAMYVLGASFGPYVVGAISDYFTTQAAISAGVIERTATALEPFRATGLRSAMYLVPILSTLLTLVLFAASRTVKKDVEKINDWMKGNSGRWKTNMKQKLMLLSIIVSFFSINTFAQKKSAMAFVESFYKFQRVRSGNFNAAEINAHKRWFTADLNKLLQNELKREREYLKQNPTDKPYFGDGLTFEPLDECYKMGKFYNHLYKISAPTADGNKTIVEIRFSNPKVCGGDFVDAYKVELIKNKGIWQINDFIYSDGKRLSDDLKRTEY